MATRSFVPVAEGGAFFEAPRWRGDRWWVSDFYRERVITVLPDGRTEMVLEVPNQPSGLGFLPDGDLLVVSMNDRSILRVSPDGAASVHADLSRIVADPLNDMAVDARGRCYVGGFGFDLFGGEDLRGSALYRVDPDGAVTVVADDLVFPNGAVITPDERTLIVGETFAARYSAFDLGDDGTLSNRRTWAAIGPTPPHGQVADMEAQLTFCPDGCDLDAEGRVWSADIIGRRCLLIEEGGGVADAIAAPEGLSFFACALGGEDGHTLLICAAPDYHEDLRRANHEAILLATPVSVPAARRG